jgi:hypothetical protein
VIEIEHGIDDRRAPGFWVGDEIANRIRRLVEKGPDFKPVRGTHDRDSL